MKLEEGHHVAFSAMFPQFNERRMPVIIMENSFHDETTDAFNNFCRVAIARGVLPTRSSANKQEVINWCRVPKSFKVELGNYIARTYGKIPDEVLRDYWTKFDFAVAKERARQELTRGEMRMMEWRAATQSAQ
jgi:hypothetical protein